MSSKRVLFIAYDFPPRGGSGVQRTVKFAKYLPEFGWEATVVCPDWSQRPSSRDDAALETEIAEGVHVVAAGPPARTRLAPVWRVLQGLPRGWAYTPKLKANCVFPDYAGEWRGRATDECERLLEGGQFHAIYTTSPPATTHAIGLRIRERFGLPWVVDLRDPWTDNPVTQRHLWSWRNRLEQVLERRVYTAADAIVANTDTNRAELLRLHGLPGSKVVTIPNGYDESDFAGNSATPPDDVFCVSYCGAARGNYHPGYFLTAYREFLRLTRPERAIVRFAGTVCNWLRKHESEAWLSEHAELLGYMPHEKIPSLLLGSHVLLSINPPDSPECVPGKLYEQLRCGRPILAICDSPSEVETMLAETRNGKSFRHHDIDGMVAFLKGHYEQWKTGRATAAEPQNEVAIRQFERRQLTRKLAGVLDALTAGDPSPAIADQDLPVPGNGKVLQPCGDSFPSAS